MNYTAFSKGDTDYMQWLKEHPEGYVLNAFRDLTNTQLVLHRTKCMHVADPTLLLDGKSYTGPDRIKVCSDDIEALKDHVRIAKQLPATIEPCKDCKAIEEGITVEV